MFTIVIGMFYNNRRIDDLRAEMNQRFGDMNQRITEVNQRILAVKPDISETRHLIVTYLKKMMSCYESLMDKQR